MNQKEWISLPSGHTWYLAANQKASGHGEEHLPSGCTSTLEEFDKGSSKCGHYSVSGIIITNLDVVGSLLISPVSGRRKKVNIEQTQ